MNRYCRADVLRILRITGRQFAQWQRAGLIAAGESFSFFDLLQIKKVRDLCARRVRPAVIRRSLEAMQKRVAGMENPLQELGTYSSGSRVIFRHDGRDLEPIAGQFLMDFAQSPRMVTANLRHMRQAETVAELFNQGVSLEDDPTSYVEAIACYGKVLELEPRHAPAHINLGTLFYNRRDYVQAEAHYRAAIDIDPRYALAYFDLGNVLDETGRMQEAVAAYITALRLAPTYGDAHYNLALAYEKLRRPRKALRHWRSYLKLDASGPWAAHARSQVKRILSADALRIIYRRSP